MHADEQAVVDGGIDVVDAAVLSYEAFCDTYMAKNVPVLVSNVGADWPVFRQWRDATGRVDHNALAAAFGDAQVPVVSFGQAEAGYGEDEDRQLMRLGDYLVLLATGQSQRYMKDWHFTRDFPTAAMYTTPLYFQDDWLNWWWGRKCDNDDYRFVYFGPGGSFTPLHHDVLESYSWSINIVGQKEWLLYPPSQTPKLLDRFGRTSARDATTANATQFPGVASARHVTIVQDVGTALFVPSGWYHQVRNLGETLSINHNWFNAYTLRRIWAFLQRELQAVEREIAHCRDGFDSDDEWTNHCQLLLRANIGMNMGEFRDLLVARLKYYDTNDQRHHDRAFALGEIAFVLGEMNVTVSELC
ncbi:Aste57867_11851 [Aphanomyces stellatus]|uniref:Aste57867_11851 protein n=1 Tax=Aphanomyces stellatus TaxID=120398 RepID=A0A485KUP5_9STRA|nr:hypothetical protein As57867_011806 [Aphanomyces stellatus]VFT88706.1 Aste57867_11851 [Aphanomyces stellatus]